MTFVQNENLSQKLHILGVDLRDVYCHMVDMVK